MQDIKPCFFIDTSNDTNPNDNNLCPIDEVCDWEITDEYIIGRKL